MNATMTKAEALATKDVGALTKICRSELAKGWKNIPPELAELSGWLLWKWETGPKKATKVPYYAKVKVKRSGEQGSPGDRAQLCTLAEAVEELKKPGGYDFAGVGLAMLADWNLTALDFDHVIDGEKVAPWVSELIDVDVTYGEASPSDTGARVFYRGMMPPALRDKKHKEGDTGFETFCAKGFVTVTGKELGIFSALGAPLPALPESVVTFAENRFQRARTDSGAPTFDPDCPFSSSSDRHADVDLEGLRWMLDQLGSDFYDDYEKWRDVGFCIHHQFHGKDEEELDALEAWIDWSAQSPLFVGGECEARWEDAKAERTGGIKTIGTLKAWVGREKWKGYMAQRRSAASSAVVVEAGWRERISTADAVTLKGPLAAEIRAAKLEKIDRETLVKHVQRRLAALEGVSPSIAAVRELLAAPREVVELLDAVPDIDDWTSTAPSWARAWAWIRSEARFINRRTKRTITKEAFDTEMQRYVTDLVVQQGEHVTEFKASERMFKHWGARAVDAVLYHPAFDEFFDRDGETFINRYRPELRRSPDAAWADGGRQMARALERHLALFLPDVRERQLFRAWLAHQYLHPGVKVRWAPLLKGCPGDGKSMFGELLELVLGVDNVKLMNADTIQTSPFSGWVEGQCVTVFEEVKFHGHNRYDVVNKLKPYIANNRVEKHGKGKDPGNIFNVTNYLMLTNHEDAIPIEEGDRRYFVLFSPFRALADMDTALQADFDVTVAEHFEEVFSLVRANPGQLALWLSETEFPAEWDANMSAPMTAAKRVMVASSRTDAEQALAEILEDVATGSKVRGVGPTVVFVPHLREEAMRRTDNRRSVGDKTVSACLREAGYLPLPGGEEGKARKVQWQGVQRSVWSKHGADISSDEVRRLLDATFDDFDG